MVEEVENLTLPNKFSCSTIYFGGGTPSLLSVRDIKQLISIVREKTTTNLCEVTVEINPDDVTAGYFQKLLNAGVNRVSIGIQSFNDNDLLFLNRRHNSKQAQDAVKMAYNENLREISLDLMFGIPGQTIEILKHNLSILFSLPITHFSAYHLTLEEGTPLHNAYLSGKIKLPTEDESLIAFELIRNMALQHGFIHYETSNFARDKHFAQHNTNYWKNLPYMGIGVGAHSFDGEKKRTVNPTTIADYLKMVNEKRYDYRTTEILTATDQANEQILIGLRTLWGVSLLTIHSLLSEIQYSHFDQKVQKYLAQEKLLQNNNTISIATKYWFIADEIIRNLMADN